MHAFVEFCIIFIFSHKLQGLVSGFLIVCFYGKLIFLTSWCSWVVDCCIFWRDCFLSLFIFFKYGLCLFVDSRFSSLMFIDHKNIIFLFVLNYYIVIYSSYINWFQQKDGEYLSGHEVFLRRVATAFNNFAETTERACRDK